MAASRIWWDRLFTLGTFPDGRIKQDVHFKDDEGNTYVWTPKWKDVIALYTSARRAESTNAPDSWYMRQLEEVARQAFEEGIDSFHIVRGSIGGLEEGSLIVGGATPEYSVWEETIPFRIGPSIAWLKAHYRETVTVYVVNNTVWEIEDVDGDVIYPEG